MDSKKIVKPNAFTALTAAAAALPGIAMGAIPAEKMSFSYHGSRYSEGDIPAGDLASNDTSGGKRYDIDVHQFAFETPLMTKFQLNIDGAVESMTGASQKHNKLEDGKLKVVMSGATISEKRTDVTTSLTRFFDRSTLGGSFGYSKENDYKSQSLGLSGSFETNEKLTTYNWAALYSSDKINPTASTGQTPIYTFESAARGDSFFSGRIMKADKKSTSLYAGVLQVINKTSTVEAGVNYLHHSGYLSDPYKEAYIYDLPDRDNGIGDRIVSDRRPDTKTGYALSARYRKFVTDANAALHLDYRFYHDDWQVTSHTLSVDWFQNLANGWQVIPGLRWYSQSEAGFYAPYYIGGRADFLASSDFRLSGYGAVSEQLQVKKQINDIELYGLIENYQSGKSYGLDSSKEENPALVNFYLVSIGIDYKFK